MRRRAIRWVRPFRASGEVIANQTGHTCLHNHRMWMFDGDCCEQSHPWVYPCRIRRKGRKDEHLGVYLSGPFFLCRDEWGRQLRRGAVRRSCRPPKHTSPPARIASPEESARKATPTPMRAASPEQRAPKPCHLRPSQIRHSRTLNL